MTGHLHFETVPEPTAVGETAVGCEPFCPDHAPAVHCASFLLFFRCKEARVEHLISNLLTRFEQGGLTRRELIQALAMVTVASGTASAAGLQAGSINHVSILVSDLQRSIDFYRRVFGLSVVNEDKANQIVRLGVGKILVSIRHEPPAGLVDHFAIGVDRFDRESVTRDLKELGLTPLENLEFGFHVKDPDGVNVQITGN